MALQRKPRPQAPPRPWSAVLAKSAAEARGDGGTKLMLLLFDAGFTRDPALSYVIRRERVAA
jgi:hypothetical protein